MSRFTRRAFAGLSVVTATAALASTARRGSQSQIRSSLTIIAPAGPGGGWDGFAREIQQDLRTEGLVNNVQVVNIPGAGGTIGLAQYAQQLANDTTLLVTGGVMVGAIALHRPEYTLEDVTPLVRLADDYAAMVVPADSELQTFDDIAEAWTADPPAFSISGGSLGSIDHLLSGRLAQILGIDPVDVNYIAYSGGGEALNSLLSHTTAIGISGYNEVADQIEAGTLRGIAVSSPERLPGVDLPTFVELGQDVTMSNWRGLLTRPGAPPELIDDLVGLITQLHESASWQEGLTRNSWTDTYMHGEELDAFIAEETELATSIVEDLGL